MKAKTSTNVIWGAIFILALIILLWPVLFSIGSSFKSSGEIYEHVLNFIPKEFTFENHHIKYLMLR